MSNGVFWRGADGNVYVKGSAGTNAAGRWDGNSNQYWAGRGFQQISDPAGGSGMDALYFDSNSGNIMHASGRNANVAQDGIGLSTGGSNAFSGGGGGGSGGPAYKPLNQAAVDATNLSINSLGQILAEALAQSQRGFDRAQAQAQAEEDRQRKQHSESSLSNMQNYDANMMASLRAGSAGNSGLMSALRGGGGAGNQFARDWVDNTVADTTANDIRDGYTTFDENRSAADSALSNVLSQLRSKREENRETFQNNQRAAHLDNAKQNQALFQQLAGIYSDAGQNDQASNFIRRSSEFTPTIAQNSTARVGDYNTKAIDVQSPDITAFAAPEQAGMSASGGKLAEGVFTTLDPRRRRETVGV